MRTTSEARLAEGESEGAAAAAAEAMPAARLVRVLALAFAVAFFFFLSAGHSSLYPGFSFMSPIKMSSGTTSQQMIVTSWHRDRMSDKVKKCQEHTIGRVAKLDSQDSPFAIVNMLHAKAPNRKVNDTTQQQQRIELRVWEVPA